MNIELLIHKIACAFGLHNWIDNSGIDRHFYPSTSHKCFWCGKRKS